MMDIKLFNFLEYNLYVEFTRKFKHIKLIKLESTESLTSKNEYNLDYDFIEFSFSKEKNDIYIYTTKEVKNIILVILEIDGEEVNISKMLMNNKIEVNTDKIKDLMSKMNSVKYPELMKESKESISKENIKYCGIKNENIFAEIKAKNGSNKINK